MKELWVAKVELLTPPTDDGDTKCLTEVVAWAESPDDYNERVSSLFQKSDCSVLGVEHCKPLSELESLSEALERQAVRARSHPEDCIFGTLHYYSSKSN